MHLTRILESYTGLSSEKPEIRKVSSLAHLPLLLFFHCYWFLDGNQWLSQMESEKISKLSADAGGNSDVLPKDLHEMTQSEQNTSDVYHLLTSIFQQAFRLAELNGSNFVIGSEEVLKDVVCAQNNEGFPINITRDNPGIGSGFTSSPNHGRPRRFGTCNRSGGALESSTRGKRRGTLGTWGSVAQE